MTDWCSISKNELNNLIQKSEIDLKGDYLEFWKLIKVDPIKWTEKEYGSEGDGFWVVAICGNNVIWFNDIEEGFNISSYKVYGHIEEYICNQDELCLTVTRLFDSRSFKK